MSDPRNVAHAKKVTQEKHHHQAKGKPGKEKRSSGAVQNQPVEAAPAPANAADAKAEQKPGDLEKSLAVLSKLKDLEFHSRANIETLAELSLTIEEERPMLPEPGRSRRICAGRPDQRAGRP